MVGGVPPARGTIASEVVGWRGWAGWCDVVGEMGKDYEEW
jgi:hypothetical protein